MNNQTYPLDDIITAIAMHESDDFTSNVYKASNNPFGMGVASVRPQNRTGNFGAYATFASIEDATDDFIAWLKYKGFKPTNYINPNENIKELVTFMRANGYFTDTLDNYLKGVTNRYNVLQQSGQTTSYNPPPRVGFFS